MGTTTATATLIAAHTPALRTTELLEPKTTANLRVLTVSSGLRTQHEMLFGDALFDRFTNRQYRNLAKAGATAAPGQSVDVQA